MRLLSSQLPSWSEGHSRIVEFRLRKYVFPRIGQRSMAAVSPLDVLSVVEPIQDESKHETANRVLTLCNQVCRFAIARGHIRQNPAADLRPALTKATPTHFAAITKPEKIGKLLRMLDAYEGSPAVMAALRLAPLWFVRPGELRRARWQDFDLDSTEPQWQYHITKAQTDHIVPLATQAVAILRALRPYTGHQEHVFPGQRNNGRVMSENTLAVAMRTIGIPKGKCRYTASGRRRARAWMSSFIFRPTSLSTNSPTELRTR